MVPARIAMISNAELDRLIAELGRHSLAERELREVKEAVFVSLSQSQPEGIEYAFCLSSGGRMHSFSGRRAKQFPLIRWLCRETDRSLPRSLGNVFQIFVDMSLIYPLGSFREAISSEHCFDHQRVMTTTGQLARLL
jgi:hypothetical protein